jgi:tight adherence protein C
MLYLLIAIVFAAAGLATYGLLSLVVSDDRRVSRRLKDMTSYEIAQSKEAQPMLKSFGERVMVPAAKSVGSATRSALPTTYREKLTARLEEAGRPQGLDADRFLFSQLIAVVGLAALAIALGVLMRWGVSKTMLLTLIAGILGVLTPDLWLRAKVSSRKHEIIRELPDMLDMLTISVEAGMGFDSALAKLVKNSRGALPEEFGRVLQEVQSGASRKDALRAMAERVDVTELSAFVASIVQADMFGVSIAQVLRAQAGDMRLRRRQRAEETAQRAPVKMVFPLIFCILPCTLIVILGPAVIRIGVVLLGM